MLATDVPPAIAECREQKPEQAGGYWSWRAKWKAARAGMQGGPVSQSRSFVGLTSLGQRGRERSPSKWCRLTGSLPSRARSKTDSSVSASARNEKRRGVRNRTRKIR